MAIKLNRSLFIGLGGTGIRSILKTKQFYIGTFGKKPDVIGFLGIDTSTQQFEEGVTTENGEKINLENSESVKLKMEGPLDYYMKHKDSFSWVPKKNVSALSGLAADGAGQIRTNGRFSFTINSAQIETAIRNAVDRVCRATNDGKGQWELGDGKVQIYLVFSLSGGTGCGTYLNTALLLRDMYEDSVVIQAYGVLPSTFQGCGMYVGANAYGALLDTDYMMSKIDPENPFKYSVYDNNFKCMYKPFDLVYLIDNVNKNGDKYTNSNELYTMIGKALSEISGPLGASVAADIDNFKQYLIDGSLDIGDKRSWICGLGLCEIIVNTQKLSKKYGLKAGQKLVSNMIGQADLNDVDEITMNWININNIREHEADQLLNSLYDLNSIADPTITATKADKAELESQSYIDDAKNQAKQAVAANYAPKISSVKSSFQAKLTEIATNNGGLKAASAFIDKLTSCINLYLKEMRKENEDLEKSIPNKKANVETVLTDWKDKKFWQKGNFSGDLADAQAELVHDEVEKIRHDLAIQFFSEFKEYINSFIPAIKETSDRLESVSKILVDQLSTIEITDDDVNPFQIDLAAGENVEGDKDTDCTVSAFAKAFKDSNILLMKDMASDEIIEAINKFTSSLAGANFEDMSVNKIIMKMSSEEKKSLFTKALRKADIVLDQHAKGEVEPENLRNALYISVYGGKDGELAKDPDISEVLNATGSASKPKFSDVPTDKKIFIFRQKGTYPVFQIASVMKQERDYTRFSERKSFCFDSALESELEDLHYTFEPNQQKEDDVLEMWVKGIIHGLVKRDGTRYYVYSPGLCNGDGSNDFMYKLKGPEEGKGSEARWYAFDDFRANKRILKSREDLLSEILKREDEMGRKQATELYKEVASCDFATYVEKYSGVSVASASTLDGAGYVNTKKLITDEDSYRRKKLVASLDNR